MRVLVFMAMMLAQSVGAAESVSPFQASAPKTHVETISDSVAAYTVQVGGLLDMDNTMTRECSNRHIAFQNNVSLAIANTGTVPVANPRVVTNGARHWAKLDELLAEFTEGAENDQERIYLIWEHMRQNRHHDDPLFGDNEFHDPVRWLNVYGGGLCDDAGQCGSALYYRLGFNAARGGQDPFTRCLHGHMQCEVWYDGDYQFMDIDENVFYLDRENRKPVSGDALARDHDLAKRELPYGPMLGSWESSQSNAALFGIDDGRTGPGITGHTMDYTLRPGEKVVFRWDNIGKHAWAHSEGPHRYYGNSKIVYAPRLGGDEMGFAADAIEGFAPSGDGLTCEEPEAALVVKTTTCYTICGGSVEAAFTGGSANTEFIIESSVDGKDYAQVWQGAGEGGHAASVVLDDALGVHGNPPRRTHYVRFSAHKGAGSTLSDVRIETDVVSSPMALARLHVGENKVEYTDETSGTHQIAITHEWVECSSVTPPVPPKHPLSPEPGAMVHETYVAFGWPAVGDCDAYWVRVSRRPDLLYPYRPNYDQVVPKNEHIVPRRGMFSPGETYYWRVRPRLASGVWGSWSPVWTFAWEGPMVPRDLSYCHEGDGIVIAWTPNPRGTRPAHYDVYGSDERGFSVDRAPHDVVGLGRVPGNFLASTTDTEMRVVSPNGDEPNMNKAYYRVVAIDADGVESCPSDFCEIPRPYVFTRPVQTAAVEQPYEYRMDTIRSIGDLQSRYVEPRASFWEREDYRFTLESGPQWLRLDEATGVLRGTPSASDVGQETVVIRVTTSYPDEVPADSKSGADFQKRRTLPDLKRECTHRFLLSTGPQGT